jgi:hypothetical protein
MWLPVGGGRSTSLAADRRWKIWSSCIAQQEGTQRDRSVVFGVAVGAADRRSVLLVLKRQ